ncbi:MAG: glycosyltransferase, partial [Crocinitomicaceae bacterium]
IKSEESANDSFNLVYAGGITPARGLATVVEAIALLPTEFKTTFTFTVCGTGSYESEIRALASELKVIDQIDFRGWVKQSEVFEFISKGNASIIPHYRSVQNDCSSPNKLYQYMLVGKPVISSNCKSLERVIKETSSGLIYENKSADELAERLQELISDKELQAQLGQNGRNAVLNQYNTKVEGQSLIKTYEKLV